MIGFNTALASRIQDSPIVAKSMETQQKDVKELKNWYVVAYRRFAIRFSNLIDNAQTSKDADILKEIMSFLHGLLGHSPGQVPTRENILILVKLYHSLIWSLEEKKQYLDIEYWERRYLAQVEKKRLKA